jgi:hypothetical protein
VSAARDVDLGAHILRQHSAQRVLERDRLGRQRRDIDRFAPTQLRRVAIQDLEELVLLHAGSSSS